MGDPGKLDARRRFDVQQALADARASEATAQRLEESYIRYLILANAGGIVACLGIAGALVNVKSAAGVVSFSTIVVPMGLFLLGLVAGGVIVSLLHKRASYAADQRAREALRILRESGQIVPAPAASFSPLELRGLPHLTKAINVLGLISQFSFVIGAVWGLVGVAIHR